LKLEDDQKNYEIEEQRGFCAYIAQILKDMPGAEITSIIIRRARARIRAEPEESDVTTRGRFDTRQGCIV